MKRIIYLAVMLVATVITYSGASAQNNVIDEIVWVVGDEAIYKSEVEEARQDGQMKGTVWDGDPYCVIPEQLAINKLFLNQAELDSIIATDEDISQATEMYYKELVAQIGNEEKLEEYYGMTAEQVKNRLYESRRQEFVITKVRIKII